MHGISHIQQYFSYVKKGWTIATTNDFEIITMTEDIGSCKGDEQWSHYMV